MHFNEMYQNTMLPLGKELYEVVLAKYDDFMYIPIHI